MAHWLLKSEPHVFGYPDLVRNGREGWDGVRSYQARIFMRAMQVGELAIFYHSSASPPGAAGICEIVGAAEPDPTRFDPASHYFDPTSDPGDPRWDWVTVAPVRELRFVPLSELRTIPELASSRLLARGNRLSVLPLADAEFDAIVRRADDGPPDVDGQSSSSSRMSRATVVPSRRSRSPRGADSVTATAVDGLSGQVS